MESPARKYDQRKKPDASLSKAIQPAASRLAFRYGSKSPSQHENDHWNPNPKQTKHKGPVVSNTWRFSLQRWKGQNSRYQKREQQKAVNNKDKVQKVFQKLHSDFIDRKCELRMKFA